MADSSGLEGAKPLALRAARLGAVPKSSLDAMNVAPVKRSSFGLASGLVMPAAAREGPRARTTTVLLVEPEMTNPPIRTLSPVWTSERVEMFSRFDAAAGRQAPMARTAVAARPAQRERRWGRVGIMACALLL
ncbi:MAG: hypothetical protein IPJ28_11205 [Betaproteobacteria bacterium]|nr:hypothetical protein [Betaproteobacteria bacterium]